MKWQVPLIVLLVLAGVPIISAWDQVFPWAGTYTICHIGAGCGAGHEVIPANVSYLFVSMFGAGGSGKSTGEHLGFAQWGYGGSAGEHGNYTMVPVIVGTTYTITVGTGGVRSDPFTASNPGGDTTAFGYTKHGGAGGLQGSDTNTSGGTGESTISFFDTGFDAVAGGASGVVTGGIRGEGSGAGGGGAANNGSGSWDAYSGQTYGGAGADGYVRIWDMNGSAANTPQYTASPTSTGVGTIVTFTDESLLNDAGNLTYDWDFGDGTSHSTVLGTTTHVYGSYGTYTTNLTLTSDTGTVYLSKPNYITITNTPITAWYTQKLVRLKVVDAFGNELENANISVSYISNTLPSKDVTWLTTAFGISQAVATQMVNGGVAMQGYTGSDGSATFTMFPAIQYGITITDVSIGLSKYVTIYPQDNDYVIYCPLTSQQPPTSKLTELVNSSIYVTQINDTHFSFNMIYQDGGGKTSNMVWNVSNVTTGVEIQSVNYGLSAGDTALYTGSFILPSTPIGTEYSSRIDATRNGVHDYYTVSIMTKDANGRLIPLGIETFVSATQAAYLYNLISICVILVIAAMSGPRSETAFTILVPLFAGIFMAFGWMRLATPSQTTGLFYVVVMMGVLGVLLYMNEQDKSTSGYSAPGKKIFKLATFLALFTAGLTVMSGFSVLSLVAAQPIPGTCTPGLSCDTYGNFDYTASSSAFTNANKLDIGSAPGWIVENGLNMAIVMINLIVGIFAFPLVLNSVLNGIAPGITAYPAYILFLGFLELAVMFIYIYGAYEFLRGAPAGSTL